MRSVPSNPVLRASRRACVNVSSMQIGDVTEPIRTPRGYQILKLETRSDTKTRSFAEARSDISQKVGDEKLRAQATITWRNDELKKAYEQALAARLKALEG